MNEMNCAVAGSTQGANTDRLTTGDMYTLPLSDVVNDRRTGRQLPAVTCDFDDFAGGRSSECSK